MSDRSELEKAFYMKRLLEKKLDKTDPELSWDERMQQAMDALQECLPKDSEDDSLFEELQDQSDEEGIGEPPMEFLEDEEDQKVKKHKKAEPTIFIIMQERLPKDVK